MKTRANLGLAFPLLTAALCLFAGGCQNTWDDTDIVWMNPNEVYKQLGDKTLVIDTRSKKDYDEGHVPDARLVKLAEVDVQDERPRFPGYKLIVVYGQNPGSSAAKAMVKRLLFTKHKNVRALEGGFDQWMREELPVEISLPNPNDPPPTE